MFGLISFRIGVHVGFRKANFANNWGNNYYKRTFGEPKKPRGFEPFFGKMGGIRSDVFTNSGSVSGEVVSLTDKTLVVMGQDGIEKNIILEKITRIKKFRDNVGIEEIKTGDSVVVFGSPNTDGEIIANLVRIIPKELKTFQKK